MPDHAGLPTPPPGTQSVRLGDDFLRALVQWIKDTGATFGEGPQNQRPQPGTARQFYRRTDVDGKQWLDVDTGSSWLSLPLGRAIADDDPRLVDARPASSVASRPPGDVVFTDDRRLAILTGSYRDLTAGVQDINTTSTWTPLVGSEIGFPLTGRYRLRIACKVPFTSTTNNQAAELALRARIKTGTGALAIDTQTASGDSIDTGPALGGIPSALQPGTLTPTFSLVVTDLTSVQIDCKGLNARIPGSAAAANVWGDIKQVPRYEWTAVPF